MTTTTYRTLRHLACATALTVAAAVVEPLGDEVRIEFRTPQRGVAPGQSAVVYRGDELLGGGRIVDVLR